MSEIPHIDPSTLTGSIDPTLLGSPEQTIALLSPEDREDISLRMDHPKSDLKLEAGKTLEEQCNDNYGYLNSRGISMTQFNGVLEAASTACRTAGGDEDYVVVRQRSDGGTETIGYQELLDGGQLNPLTGKMDFNNGRSLFVVDNSPEGSLRMWMGFSNIEAEAAKQGVFGAPNPNDVQGSCRAEQILERIGATEFGQNLLAEQRVGTTTPEQPIAPVEIPSGPTPQEKQLAREAEVARTAEVTNEQLTPELTDTLMAIRATTPPEEIDVQQLPDKGKRYRIKISDEPKEVTADMGTVRYSVGTWIEISEPKKGKPTYTILTGRKYEDDDDYRFGGVYGDAYAWQEGGKCQRIEVEKRDGFGHAISKVGVDPEPSELEDLRQKIVEQNRETVDQWNTKATGQSKRIGFSAMRLFGRSGR